MVDEKGNEVPSPGSYMAVIKGCKCGILDNNYGDGVYTDKDSGLVMYYINSDCPLHGDVIIEKAQEMESKQI